MVRQTGSSKRRWFTAIGISIAVSVAALFIAGYRVELSVSVVDRINQFDERLVRAIQNNAETITVRNLVEESPHLIKQEFSGHHLSVEKAVLVDRPELVKLLLDFGADPNLRGPGWIGNRTAVEQAILHKNPSCLEILLESGRLSRTTLQDALDFAREFDRDIEAEMVSAALLEQKP